MKRIGLLISEMNNGGAERVVARLTQILSEKYEIYLILFEDTYMAYDFSGTLINMNIKSAPGFLKKILNLLKRILFLRKIKNKYSLNIVISFLDSPNIVNILSKTKKCKTYISIRNYTVRELKDTSYEKIVKYIIRILYKFPDIIIPVSKEIAESYINEFKIDNRKIEIIYNPFDVKQIQKMASELLEVEYCNFVNENKIFISVGRIMHQKGFWHLIKAFKIVHEKHQDTRLVIVGKDYDDGKINKLIDDLDLNNSVLLTGQQQNPFKFVNSSYAYVLSSLYEGFPNSLVEAMACGCPVIATDCKSGPREILFSTPKLSEEYKSIEIADYGLLVKSLETIENWNPNEFSSGEKNLADAMSILVEDQYLHSRMRQESTKRAEYFDYMRCKKRFLEIIESNR